MNNRRLTKKKQVQLLVALTILAWATQTLLHQWGYGQVVTPDQSAADQTAVAQAPGDVAPAVDVTDDLPPAEKFVPGNANATPSGTLELREEARVSGGDVSLKQICRWSDSDASVFTPIADLTVMHFPSGVTFQTVSVDQIRQTLHDAGVNIAMINFAGVMACSVTRTDGQSSGPQTVEQWLDSQQPQTAKASSTPVADTKPDPNYHVLRDLLTNDLSQRLNIPPDQLQLSFDAEDEKVLNLAEPIFKFDITPSRARALGNVSWEVTILTDSASKKMRIEAVARAWEEQVIAAKTIAMHQVLEPADFTTRRVMVDSAPAHQLLHLDQCAGVEAAEDIQPGTVMTVRLVNPIPLVKPGQLVTVNLRRGTVQLRSVARAMEEGSLGQTIRVRNENTRDVLDVTVTGAQEARLGESTDQSVSEQNTDTPNN
jgi:flagella basal body P-ring formation protein FlgA